MISKKVFIVGMPGSGKSTLGKALSEQLGWDFIDLDNLIEEIASAKVTDIFAEFGESRFRELEKEALNIAISKSTNLILATGGGTPCFFDNMDQILKSGVSIFIDPPLETLASRLQGKEMAKRPLIAEMGESDLLKSISEKYNSRVPFYNKANHKIKGDESIESISLLV